MAEDRIRFGGGGNKPQTEPQKVTEQPTVKPVEKKEKSSWVIKDRIYRLTKGKSPLSKSIKAANIYYFDEEKGYERELKNTSNQQTCFVDEMKGDQLFLETVF